MTGEGHMDYFLKYGEIMSEGDKIKRAIWGVVRKYEIGNNIPLPGTYEISIVIHPRTFSPLYEYIFRMYGNVHSPNGENTLTLFGHQVMKSVDIPEGEIRIDIVLGNYKI